MSDYESKITRAWQYYEIGRAYNNRLVPNQYNLVSTNIEFFAGNQWVHLPQTPAMQKLSKPMFNIVKRITSLFVASLTSSAATVSFDELSYYSGDPEQTAEEYQSGQETRSYGNTPGQDLNGADVATAEVQNLLEKFKMDYRIREALFDGAQTGDFCAHFWWDADARPFGGAFGDYRGEIKMELVDGINVMFGNPNTPDVDRQPYILVIGRDTVENLRWEMERHRKRQAETRGAGKGENGDPGKAQSAFLGRGGARECSEEYPQGCSEWSGLCDDEVQPDAEYQFQAGIGGRTELDADSKNGKALYVYLYEKKTREEVIKDPLTGAPKREPVVDKNGDPVQAKNQDGVPLVDPDGNPIYKMRDMKRVVTTIHVSKMTRSCVIFEDIDTGLSRYPIAWGNWERQKNQYHGRALVTGIIPNQIFINTMFAMVMRHLQLMGFPKTVYNADLISQWNNEVGQAIGVRGLQPGQRISDVAYNLSPADMSNQIIQVIDKAIAYTKDCLGATDAQLGNVKPDNTSALMVLQSSAEVPLENTRAGMFEWLEEIGHILLDFMGTHYGERPIVRTREFQDIVRDPLTNQPMLDPTTGVMMLNKVSRRVVERYDFSKFKHLWFNVRVNAGAATYYSEIAMVQTLDNLRRDGTLEVIDYLERIPDKLIPRKAELIQELRQRAAQMGGSPVQASAPTGSGVNPTVGGPISKDKALAEMPGSVQARFSTLPTSAQNALLKKASLGN